MLMRIWDIKTGFLCSPTLMILSWGFSSLFPAGLHHQNYSVPNAGTHTHTHTPPIDLPCPRLCIGFNPTPVTSFSWPPLCDDKKQTLWLSFHIFTHCCYLSPCPSATHLSVKGKNTYPHTKTKNKNNINPAWAAIKAINQSWLEAKIEGWSDGYICYIPSSICLSALENAASLVCKHIVPITLIQLAKHEMTVKAVWGAFCLQTRQSRESLKARPCTNNAGWDLSSDEKPRRLSVGMSPIFLSVESWFVSKCIILSTLNIYK